MTHSWRNAYSEEAVKQIRFIKRAQQLGFSLKEILELLTLRVDGETSCEQVKESAAAKLAEVEQKIVELTGIDGEGKPLTKPFDHTASIAK